MIVEFPVQRVSSRFWIAKGSALRVAHSKPSNIWSIQVAGCKQRA